MAQKETNMEDARAKTASEVDTNILSLREGVASYLHDADPEETQEWMDSLDGLLEAVSYTHLTLPTIYSV